MIGLFDSIYIDEKGLRRDGSIDLNSLDTVTVSVLDEYHLGKKLARLAYAKPVKPIEEI